MAEKYKTILNRKTGEVRRVPADYVEPIEDQSNIDMADASALRNLAKSKLVAIIEQSPATPGLVPAIRELLDRIDGKAPQAIIQTTHITGAIATVNLPATKRFIDMLTSPTIDAENNQAIDK